MTEVLGVATGPRPRRDAVRNRSAVITAACALLEEHGAAHVTMDAVAARAGLGKGTVFRHFESREGLMLAMLERAEAQWWASDQVAPAADGGQDGAPFQRLLAFGEAWTEFIHANAAVLEAAGGAGLRRHAKGSTALAYVRELLDSLGVRGDTTFLALAALSSLESSALMQQDARPILLQEATRAGRGDLLRRLAALCG